MKRLESEWYILKETFIKLKEFMDHGATLRQALWTMFNKNGKYSEDNGPWINGSYYNSIRWQWWGRRKGRK